MPLLTVKNITADCRLILDSHAYIDPSHISPKKHLRNGDILFNWRNGSKCQLGKTGLFQGEGAYTFVSFLYLIRGRPGLNSEYLYQYLKFLKESGRFLRAKKNVNLSINRNELANFPIPIPPLTDQSAITRTLAEFDQGNHLLAEHKELAQKHKEALIEYFCTQRNRYPGFSDNLRERTLRSFVSYQNDYFEPPIEGSLPCIGLRNIEKKTGRLLERKDSGKAHQNTFRFQKGDLLFCKLRPTLRKFYLAEFDGICSTQFIILRPIHRICDPFYLSYLIQSSAFMEACKTTGSRPRTTWNIISSWPHPLPSLPEQKAICQEIGQADQYIKEVRRGINLHLNKEMRRLIFNEMKGEPIKA